MIQCCGFLQHKPRSAGLPGTLPLYYKISSSKENFHMSTTLRHLHSVTQINLLLIALMVERYPGGFCSVIHRPWFNYTNQVVVDKHTNSGNSFIVVSRSHASIERSKHELPYVDDPVQIMRCINEIRSFT